MTLLLVALMATNTGINIIGTNSLKHGVSYSTNGINLSVLTLSAINSDPTTISFTGKAETNVIYRARVVASHSYRPICIYMDTNDFLSVSFVDENGKPRTFKSKTPMVEVKEEKK